MKCISTRITFIILSIFGFSFFGNSQSKYVFTGATLDSGTALSVGAVYKFTNVKSGVDARVKILDITGGISITNIDGSGGFSQALQPVLTVPPYSNGYVEMQVTFYQAGTSTLLSQTEVPVTPIDVDGQMYSGLPLYEFDEVEEINGYTYFQYAGSELTMTRNGSWAVGKNNAAIDYPGIDTAQKQVMFTTVNANISSMRIRVGADNRSGTSASRLRSLYFLKFDYPYSYVLEKEPVITFSGDLKNDQVELKGIISENQNFDKVIIERSVDGTRFEVLKELPLLIDQNHKSSFTYWDNSNSNKARYYRLRLFNSLNKTEQLSSIVLIKERNPKVDELRFINTIVNSNSPVLTIESEVDEALSFYITDLNGQIYNSGFASIYKGTNAVKLSNSGLQKGNFVIVIRTKKKVQSQKIVIR